MTGTDSVAALVRLLQEHPDDCARTGGLSPEDIARAERELGLPFPPSYRYFLAELGSCEASGEEFLGIYRTPAMGGALLGTVSETLFARTDSRFPPGLAVVRYDGMGGLVSLDTTRRGADGENPVVVWDPGSTDRGGPELLAGDFGSYALRCCTRALRRQGR
jgi:hypothetical protein